MEGTRVNHPNLGLGNIFDDVETTTLVKFDNGIIKRVHTRLLTIVTDEEKPVEKVQIIKKEKPETKAHKKKRLRNERILSLLKEGYTYVVVAKKCKLTANTVNYVAKANGIDYMKDKKTRVLALIEKIKQDINEGLSYREIKDKHKLLKKDIHDMYCRGFLAIRTFKAKRNAVMSGQYKAGVVARRLTSKKLKELRSIGQVYHVVSGENKVYRYPKIKRGYKGLFEDKEVIDIITDLMKKKASSNEIAKALNKAGYKTPYGFKYKWHHVQHRITKLRNKKHKITAVIV